MKITEVYDFAYILCLDVQSSSDVLYFIMFRVFFFFSGWKLTCLVIVWISLTCWWKSFLLLFVHWKYDISVINSKQHLKSFTRSLLSAQVKNLGDISLLKRRRQLGEGVFALWRLIGGSRGKAFQHKVGIIWVPHGLVINISNSWISCGARTKRRGLGGYHENHNVEYRTWTSM